MPLLAELSQCSSRCFLAVDFSKKYGKIIHGGGDSYAEGEEPPFPAPQSLIRRHKKRGNVLASCGDCKKEHNASESVPYIVHEASMARMERQAKRLWVTVLALIVILVATNGAWIWNESQFDEVKTVETYEANVDNGGNAIANGSGEVAFDGYG